MAKRKNNWQICRYGAHNEEGRFSRKDCVYGKTEREATKKALEKKFPTASPIYRFGWIAEERGNDYQAWEWWGYLE